MNIQERAAFYEQSWKPWQYKSKSMSIGNTENVIIYHILYIHTILKSFIRMKTLLALTGVLAWLTKAGNTPYIKNAENIIKD